MDRNPALQAVIGFVHELYVSGVSRVVVSPGSRSTPLTIACARQPGLTVYNVLDERSAAFLALGMARALHQPVALICTSGTAAANYLPAVVEAHFSRVPLLLLTADRPPELRGIGANQTIWQTRLYGPYVKWFYELPVPEESAFMMRHARAQANRAVAIAAQAPQGPVHINWPLREPLLPPVVETAAVQGRDVSLPATSIYSESRQAPASAELWASRLHQYKRGLIVCGPRDDPETAGAARALARRTGWVLLADPLSQARTNCRDDDFVLWEYDTLLRAWTIEDRLVAQPDVIIRTGATPTSKVLGECLSLWREARHIVIDEALMENDPFVSTTDAIQASPAEWLNALMESPGLTLTTSDSAFTKLWQAGRDCVRAATAAHLSALGRLNEGRIITELADMLPDGACLFVGNSMPVRDLDSFFPCTDKNIRVLANRGASGIDGVVSSALGTAAALPVPCTLVIGDLSFLHDLGGLLAAKQQRIALTIVVVQNDGGGIFSFLPQAQEEDVFAHFSTPHGLSLEGAAALFGGHYTRAENWETLRDALSQAQDREGWSLIEVPSNRDENLAWHRALWKTVAREWAASTL